MLIGFDNDFAAFLTETQNDDSGIAEWFCYPPIEPVIFTAIAQPANKGFFGQCLGMFIFHDRFDHLFFMSYTVVSDAMTIRPICTAPELFFLTTMCP